MSAMPCWTCHQEPAMLFGVECEECSRRSVERQQNERLRRVLVSTTAYEQRERLQERMKRYG